MTPSETGSDSAPPTETDRAQRLADEVAKASKARHVLPEFLTNLCRRELDGPPKTDREAVKRVKRSLHQVGGAYLTPPPRYERCLGRLRAAGSGPDRSDILAGFLGAHASMRERLDRLSDYYAALFAGLDEPDAVETVIDLACGLNPLGLAAMPVTPRRYLACDVYLDLLSFVAEASELIGAPVETFAHDLLTGAPEQRADVALLLKTLPCLEQLDADIGRRLLETIPARHIIVTYPVRSLGGVERGMRTTYADRFNALVEPLDLTVTALDPPFELAFRLTRP